MIKWHNSQITINLVFSSLSLSHTLTACRLREDLDHGSDHYHIGSSFLFSPHLIPHVLKPLEKKADRVSLSLSARELDLFQLNFETSKDIDTGVDKLVKWIKEVVAQHIPLLKPTPFSIPWWTSQLTQLVRNFIRARREHGRRPSADA
jgi:hypothetical protein